MAIRFPFHFLKQFLFWMLYFMVGRLVFILYNWEAFEEVPFSDIFGIFWYAIYLDISAGCYIMALPFVLVLVQSVVKLSFLNWLNRFYAWLIIVVISVITSSELGVYEEWGIKLHYKTLTYLSNPSEVLDSAQSSVITTSIMLIIFQTVIGIIAYNRWIHQRLIIEKRNWIISSAFLFITPPLLILGLRGGTQQIPINQSDVYFSRHNIANLAAVNSPWNLMHSIEQNKAYMSSNPYVKYDAAEAQALVEKLHYTAKDTTTLILNTEKPNVVLIILESWSADLVEELGGEPGITPEFSKLCKDGLLFSNCYATGARSDQGMAAIFSGYPAQPTTSIIKQANKYQQLPCINEHFLKMGYSTSFLFGGQLSYGNIKGYMYYNGFEKITEGKDFHGDGIRGKLGVHDEFVLARHLEDLQNEQEPFLSSVFTLSSHSPYDQPMEEVLKWGDNECQYINSAYYTDRCLGEYFEQAKKQPWYDNTLFIILADHSHKSYRNHNFYTREYRKIPMLFYGKVLKPEYRGAKYDKICSQVDLPATLLAQFGIRDNRFKWSKNLLNPYTGSFCYYGFVDGLGWMQNKEYFVYHKSLDRILFEEYTSDEQVKITQKAGYAYLQVLFQEYLDY